MDPTQISVTIFMVGTAFAIIAWLISSQEAASARRMMGMIAHVGVDSGTVTLGDPRNMAIRKEARRRCSRCPREDLCDRWLAGKVEGSNAFCPNARTFRILAEASAPTG